MARLKAFDEDRALDLAVDCFWSRGYEGTSVRDLAESMGIGGASLYNTYGDKRALFVRSLERYANRSMRERIARLEANRRPKEAILAFLAEIIDRSVADPDRKGCLLVNSAARRRAARRGDRQRGRRLSRRDPRLLPPQHRGRPQGGGGAEADRGGVGVGPPAGRGAGHSRAGANRREAETARSRRPAGPRSVRREDIDDACDQGPHLRHRRHDPRLASRHLRALAAAGARRGRGRGLARGHQRISPPGA